MYASIGGEKYPVQDVRREGGTVTLTFGETDVGTVGALASALPEQMGVYTDGDNLIYDFRGYTVATEVALQPGSGLVTLTVRQPYAAEVEVQTLRQQLSDTVTRQAFLEDCIAEMAMQVYSV